MLTSPAVPSLSPLEYGVALLGGSGDNDMTLIGTDPVGGTPTSGPAGSVFLEGNGCSVDVFGNFLVEVAD